MNVQNKLESAIAGARKAPRRQAGMSQTDKIAALASITLLEWREQPGIPLRVTRVEYLATQAGMKGRVLLNLGVGLSGKNGLGLWLHREPETRDWIVTKNRDNAQLLIQALGDGLVGWLVEAELSEQELIEWIGKLQPAQ
jgi:hypothetical protein